MIKCPKCHSTKVVPVIYGYPAPEALKASERGEIILGGCMVSPGQPDYGCLDCGHRWSKKSMPATAIIKVRFKCWENGPGYIEDMKKWIYEIYPDGKMHCYFYRGDCRKYESKEKANCSAGMILEFYRQLKKAALAAPEDIVIGEVCDGCSYQLQISFTDGRKEILNGDIGGGTIDELMKEFLRRNFTLMI